MIDELLLQRPAFERQEIVIQGESFDLFQQDLKCIRALYSDPQHAEYLCMSLCQSQYDDLPLSRSSYWQMVVGNAGEIIGS